uniref:Uncharacterized protein n=1 Tax=Avena sativa TaxID=4498 RepID=A0ACD5X957_AVESA
MDHVRSMEEQIAMQRIQKKLEEVNAAAQKHLQGVQDHVSFTMQKAYFQCAYECFDRRRNQEGVNSCVENCSVPVLSANHAIEDEMAKFQERMNRSLMVCQDKFEGAKLQKMKTDAFQELESCVNRSIEDSIRVLPHVVEKIKSTINMKESS